MAGPYEGYKLVDTPETFAAFLADLRQQQPRFAFDTEETTGLDPLRADIVGLAFAWKDGEEAYYLPVRCPAEDCRSDGETMVLEAALRPIFEDPAIGKVNQNIKYDLLVLRKHGVRVASALKTPAIPWSPIICSMPASRIAQPRRDDPRVPQAREHLDRRTSSARRAESQLSMAEVPLGAGSAATRARTRTPPGGSPACSRPDLATVGQGCARCTTRVASARCRSILRGARGDGVQRRPPSTCRSSP